MHPCLKEGVVLATGVLLAQGAGGRAANAQAVHSHDDMPRTVSAASRRALV